jgi:hypothetical protein
VNGCRFRKPGRLLLAALAGAVLLLGAAACDRPEPRAEGTPPILRRLTQDQYRNVIRDAFGADIEFGGRLDPDLRDDGLIALGAAQATITPVGFEQYDALARSIAAQLMEPRRRAMLLTCKLEAPDGGLARDCARTVLNQVGRALFRRPPTESQLDRAVQLSDEAAARLADPYQGVQSGLAMLLASPSFLFIKEQTEPATGASADGAVRLDAYSRAARLSFLLWNSAPDEALLAAAEAGQLNTAAGLGAQVDRMMASPRLEAGVRAFFRDFLQLANFEAVAKDPVIYPKFSPTVAVDAPEQTLRTVVAHVIGRDGDYRDLLTTRDTYLTRALGVIYQVPVEPGHGWTPYRFGEDDPRAGLLSQLSFTALYALPGRSSPTLRGKAVREILMCQEVPPAPPNVDFTKFEAASLQGRNTARDRLAAHSTDPTCAGCHKVIDPIGLALERFDGVGALRDREGGASIDVTGELDGVSYTGAAGLGRVLHDNPALPACVVRRLYAYATGHAPAPGDTAWLDHLMRAFAGDGYRVKGLLRRIAASENFYRIMPPAGGGPDVRVSAPAGSTAAVPAPRQGG